MTVADIDPKLQFVSDSQDVDPIREFAPEYDSFFVDIADGEYTEVWGMYGVIPWNEKQVYRVL